MISLPTLPPSQAHSIAFAKWCKAASLSLGLVLLSSGLAAAFEDSSAAIQAAQTKHRAKDYAGALQAAEAAERLAGDNATQACDALLLQSAIAEEMGDTDKAIEFCNKVSSHAGSSPTQIIAAASRKAHLLHQQGKTEEAEKALTDALAGNTLEGIGERTRYHLVLASFYERIGKPEKGIETLTLLCEDGQIPPLSLAAPLQERGKLLIRARRAEEARADFQRIVDMEEARPIVRVQALALIADSYRSEGNFAKAREVYTQVATINGLSERELRSASENAFRYFQSRGNLPVLKGYLETIWKGDLPEDSTWYFEFGRVAEAAGQNEEALGAWRKALAAPGIHPRIAGIIGVSTIELLAKEKKRDEIKETIAQFQSRTDLPEEQAYLIRLVAGGLDNFKDDAVLTDESVTRDARIKGFDQATKIFMNLGDFETANTLADHLEATRIAR